MAQSMANYAMDVSRRYPLLAAVGRGQQAALWRTRDLEGFSLFPLVIKSLHPALAEDHAARAMFCQEAEVLSCNGQAWGPRLYDRHTQIKYPFFVREYSVGVAFAQLGKNVARKQQLMWLADVAQALSSLHAGGWVHGDIKPANIICGSHGKARLVDFGSAYRRFDMALDVTPWRGWQVPLSGSAAYQPPADTADGAASYDTRRDLYALAVIVHEVCTGRHPFRNGREPEVQAPLGVSKVLWRRVLAALTLDPAVRRNGAVWLMGGKDRWSWSSGRAA